MSEEMQTTTETLDVAETTGSDGISASQVREHKLFKQLAKQISERDAKLAKIEADRAEQERQRAIQLEVEKGNYTSAIAQIEAAKKAELEQYEQRTARLERELELTRTSTKLLAAGAVTEKAAQYLSNEYLAIPAEERLPFEKWIESAKVDESYQPFFSAAPKISAPADRSGVTATRGSTTIKQYENWFKNPRTCTQSQLGEAINYHAKFIAQNGRPPW